MNAFFEEVGRELKGLLTVGLYVMIFSLAVPVINWLARALEPGWSVLSALGAKARHSEFLPHVLAVFATVVASWLLNWFLVWRQRRELRALIGIIYETFYGAIRPEDRTIYRVSCYRYHDSAAYRFLRREFRFTSKSRTRRPLPGLPFLECIARYGHEGRRPVRKPTSLTMAVSPEDNWSEGFAGLVAREQGTLISRSKDINSVVGRVKPKEKGVKLVQLRERLWLKVKEGVQGREGEVAWSALEDACDLASLTDGERANLAEFVVETNTTPYLLLGVRGGKTHCNNFFGFPVFSRDRLWGVVTIDALDEEFERKMAKRLEPLRNWDGEVPPITTEVVEKWIQEQLKLFAKVFDDFVQA
jgi:hypothetical protein